MAIFRKKYAQATSAAVSITDDSAAVCDEVTPAAEELPAGPVRKKPPLFFHQGPMNGPTLVSSFIAGVLALLAAGFKLFPVAVRGKVPLISKEDGGNGYKDATDDRDAVERWWRMWPSANVGLPTGAVNGFMVLDVDGEEGRESLARLEEAHGPMPSTVVVDSGGGGEHHYFRLPEGVAIASSAGKIGLKLDIRGEGGYIIAPPSVHENGTAYRLRDDDLDIRLENMAEMPGWLVALCIGERASPGGGPAPATPAPEVIPEGQRNATLVSLGGTMRRRGMEPDEIAASLAVVNENRCDPPLPPDEVVEIAESLGRYEPAAPAANNGNARAAGNTSDLSHERFTDVGNAARLLTLYGALLFFCAAWNRWLHWDGARWVQKRAQELLLFAKLTARSIYAEAEHASSDAVAEDIVSHGKRSQNFNRLMAMINLAAADLTIEPDRLDADPWLFNVQNGTIDLRTGVLRPHNKADLLTKIAPVIYDPDARCPIFDSFLNRITDSDIALQSYLQRVVGYALTGCCAERKVFVLHGGGANGKSTFLNVVLDLVGDYGQGVPTSVMMANNRGGVPNDIARLKGVKIAVASEGEMNQRLAEGLIKQQTGRDRMTARFLFMEYFDFVPSHSLFLSTNHKPLVRGSDNGIWDRIALIPFNVRIPEEERDQDLPAKLRAELPGILNWALAGTAAWLAERDLAVPDCVRQATIDYRAEMDVLGSFVADRCSTGAGFAARSSELYSSYSKWCAEAGEKPDTRKAFANGLREHGYEPTKRHGERFWKGLCMKGPDITLAKPVKDEDVDDWV